MYRYIWGCPFSLVVEHQSCKLEVASSILAEGYCNILCFISMLVIDIKNYS